MLCWGDNHYGQLGDGTSIDRGKPVAVSGLSSGVTAIAAGDNHTCALVSSGESSATQGHELRGGTELGSGRPSSAPPSGGVALDSTGAAKCWGYNRYGQLGSTQNLGDAFAANTVPLDVSGLSSGVSAITLGSSHSCARLSTGAVKCWGWNRRGQVGRPLTDCTICANPTTVAGLVDVVAIDAGVYHTCAVLATGGVKCWGQNLYGELGTTTGSPCVTETLEPIACAPAPIDVPGLSSVIAVAAGGENAGVHTCALLSSGAVKCWGANSSGQLGDGQACGTICQSPVDVSGLDRGVTAIAAGGQHSCALLGGATAYCWGVNGAGQLGNGDRPNNSTVPAAVCPDASCPLACLLPCDTVLSNVVDIALGVTHACAALSSGAIKCWGGDSLGQLGDSLACGESCDTPVDVLLPKAGLSTPTSTHLPTLTPTPAARAGDANCDGRTDSIDAALVLQYSAGLVSSLPCQANADVGGPDGLNAIDAALILQFVAGLIPHFV